MDKMDADIKTIARSIIQGNEKRKKRIKTKKASAFDIKAAAIVMMPCVIHVGISRASGRGGRCRRRFIRALYITRLMST